MATRVVLCAALLAVAVAVAFAQTDYVQEFKNFQSKYGRLYGSESEGAMAFQAFVENMQTAKRLQAENPMATFGMNEFADIPAAQFKTRHNGQKHFAAAAAKANPPAPEAILGLPQSVDWRKKGAVTNVKNQGQCGSCWSFSTTGNIEGQWFLAGNTLTAVSEQELVSCDTTDNGCNGGLMDNAFNWLLQNRNGEIVTEASYPYVSGGGQVPSCNMANRQFGAKISGFKDVAHDETTMAKKLGEDGPIAIAVDATSWQMYSGGIMTNCQSNQLDHGVLIVGFEGTGSQPYWIVKNSWGPGWGESGYIRLAFGSNQCLINNYPTSSKVNGSAPHPTAAPGATPAPTPAPSTGDTFTQKQCTNAACTEGCMSHTFPQHTCLRLQGGGSAKATCTATALNLQVFVFATDCTGFSTNEANPINQCAKDENGSYFENECSNAPAAELRIPRAMRAQLNRLRKH